MANKYRKKQVRAPYRRFQGGDGPADPVGTLVYLGASKKKLTQHLGRQETPAIPLRLPLELLMLVVEFCTAQDALNLLLTSKMWYLAALPKVYRAPLLNARNFPRFIHLLNDRKDLSTLVKDLDLTNTIQAGKNSWIAKLLRNCSENLLRLAAPQTNFGFSPMMALKSCKHLKILDLACVSDSVELPQLLDAIRGFKDLEVLRFPRYIKQETIDLGDFEWPGRLRSLGLSSHVPASILTDIQLPATLTSLELQNCPQITDTAVWTALSLIGSQLKSLTVRHPMALLSPRSMDLALLECPNLTELGLSIEYFSRDLLDEDTVEGHPLVKFSVSASSSLGITDKMDPEDLFIATDYLPNLSQVRLSVVLGWSPLSSDIITELASVLDDRGGGLYC